MDPELAWTVRSRIYDHIVAMGFPPTVDEIAQSAGITRDDAAAVFSWLHAQHALVLDQDGAAIRIANPFSGVPTRFRVHANGRSYWANCAWDALGIPAALHADATIDAVVSDDDSIVQLAVTADTLRGGGELVHFPLPFAAWYDDLIHT